MEVVRLERVGMTYRNPHVEPVNALANATYAFEKGKSYAITGESGAGKSTLLNIIAGLITPTAGKITVMGKDWSRMSDREKSRMRGDHIGLVVQDFALIEHITVLENCVLASVLAGKGKKLGERRAKKLLKLLGLTEYQMTKACYLSGGQRQRVAIARALMNEPEIILADEPTGALDSVTGMHAVETLLGAAKETSTIIMVTHNIAYADLCDNHIVIRDGVLDA